MSYIVAMKIKTLVALLALSCAVVVGEEEDEEDNGKQRMANFIGGVLGKGGIVTGRNTAVTSDGEFVSYNGQGFATSRGYYGTSGNQTWGKDGLVVKSGSLFYGANTAWKNGNSYTSEDGESSWVVTDPD